MTERGSSLVEVLIAALVGSLVVFAAGSVYVSAVRSGRDDDSLTYLQRQGSLILDEIGRQVRPADTLQGPPGQLTACGGVAGSIQANVPDELGVIQPWCFRLDAAGGTQLIEDRPAAAGGGSPNMLAGSPFAITMSACPADPIAVWPDGVNLFRVHPDPAIVGDRPDRVEVCFVLNNATIAPKAVTFRTTFTCRPCNELEP